MNIQQIKEKYTCLDYLGDRVVKKVANGYLAHAPWREDNNPSLTVSLNGRGWKDQATGAHGSVIDLVMLHHGCDVKEACEILLRDTPSFSFPQPIQSDCGGREKVAFTRFDVVPITSRGLYAYLHQRCVNTDIAKHFLVEVRYSTKEPVTTHFTIENAPVVVFEGFFDMLSFATLCGGVRHNYVVLNSCSMKESALEVLKGVNSQIYLCLDNDKGGEDATAWLLQHLPSAKDIRSRFAPYKDVNEYLINLKHKGNGTE